MNPKTSKSKAPLLIAVLFLLLAAVWYGIWNRLGSVLGRSRDQAAFNTFTYEGAYYAKCDLAALRCYLPDAAQIDGSLCGEELGALTIPTKQGEQHCPLYAEKDFPEADPAYPLLVLAHDGTYSVYECAGFASLDESPSVYAVCAAYGIGAGSSIAEVRVSDSDGTLISAITGQDDLERFFQGLLKLGDDIGEEGLANAYRDAYTEACGDDGKVTVENGRVRTADDETYQKAMKLWSEGICTVDIRLQNGLQLRGAVYAPVPAVFSLYGDYRITVPLFT